MKYCDCLDYTFETAKINVPILRAQTDGQLEIPDGWFKPWAFCPWCGLSLDTANMSVRARASTQPLAGS